MDNTSIKYLLANPEFRKHFRSGMAGMAANGEDRAYEKKLVIDTEKDRKSCYSLKSRGFMLGMILGRF